MEDPSAAKKQKIFSFQWSFKYLLIGMRLVGLRLDESADRIHFINRFLGLFVACALLVSNLFINFKSLEQDLLIKSNWKEYNGYLAGVWNDIIGKYNDTNTASVPIVLHFIGNTVEHLSEAVLVCGNHLVFFFILLATNKWKDLWSTLMFIQQEIQLSESFYRKCRNRCLVGLGALSINFTIAASV